jgi:hypothetical protein
VSVEAPTFAPPEYGSPNGGTPADSIPDGCTFIWEEPPVPAARGRAAGAGNEQSEFFTQSVLPQLKANPGRYAKVFTYAKRSSASSRIKRLREQHPGISFIARGSGSQDGQPIQPEWSVVYAAWVDGGEEPTPPAE